VKKKVLIICHNYNYHTNSFVNALLASQSECDIYLLCSDLKNSFDFDKPLNTNNFYRYKSFQHLKSSKIASILSSFSLIFKLLSIKGPFKTIELHFPSLVYWLIPLVYRLKAKRLGICFWGDDLKMMSSLYKSIFDFFKSSYDYVITGNTGYAELLVNSHNISKDKIHHIGFGSSNLDVIKRDKHLKEDFRKKLNISKEQTVITCCHNASKALNIELIIDHLYNIKADKNNIKLLFLMTYPKDEEYVKKIKSRLTETGFDYILEDLFISEQAIATYRIITDIFIHIQNSDSFSVAMVEYFYSGAIVINGEWLNYEDFKAKGGFFLKCKRENLNLVVDDAIANKPYYFKESAINAPIIWELKSWETNIRKWIKLF
jgi:glycosyltransferase involved in cell wall biosynthesis